MNRIFWTFPVPGANSLVVSAPDWEGFLFLNPTAAWIFERRDSANLASEYSTHFGIAPSQAASDIQAILDDLTVGIPKSPAQPITLREAEYFYTGTYQIESLLFRLSLETQDLTNEIRPRLVQLLTKIPPSDDFVSFQVQQSVSGVHLYKDGIHFASETFITAARGVLLQELARLAKPDRFFNAILHAGASGTTQSAVILAGASFSGKSTLCTALIRSGLLCLADDSACITPDFQVAGMPFAISLREGAWQLFPDLNGQRFIPSNLNSASPTVPARAIVFINYQPAAEATTLEAIDTFTALLEIQKSGFWVEHEQTAITAFLNWLAKIPKFSLTYSNLSEAVAQIRKVIS